MNNVVIVRFKGIGSFEQRIHQGANALHLGGEYVVLEVFCQADGQNYFRIEYSQDELPALFDSRLFDVSTSEFSESWVLSVEDDGSLTVGPKAWSVSGFWEAYMNRDMAAIEVYNTERLKIMGK